LSNSCWMASWAGTTDALDGWACRTWPCRKVRLTGERHALSSGKGSRAGSRLPASPGAVLLFSGPAGQVTVAPYSTSEPGPSRTVGAINGWLGPQMTRLSGLTGDQAAAVATAPEKSGSRSRAGGARRWLRHPSPTAREDEAAGQSFARSAIRRSRSPPRWSRSAPISVRSEASMFTPSMMMLKNRLLPDLSDTCQRTSNGDSPFM